MIRLVCLVSAAVAVLAAAAASQSCNEVMSYLPDDVAGGKYFGTSVAFEGNTIVAGAPFDQELDSSAGAAYVFDADTGAQRFKLFAADGQRLDTFGSSVALHGTTALIGMERSASPAYGAAYLFDTATGTQLNKLVPQSALPSSGFGHAVAMNDDYIVVGAPYDDAVSFNAGAVYVFDATTGMQIRRIDPGANTVWFGWSLALDGSVLAIGSPRETTAFGAAVLIDLTTGMELAQFTASDFSSNDRFGTAVALDSNRLVVGAPGNIGNGGFSGAAYVYDRSSGDEVARLVSNGLSFEKFGTSLAMEGSTLVVGAPFDLVLPSTAPGAAYLFDLNTGVQRARLFPSDGQSYVQSSHIGASIALQGGTAVVGAPGTNQSILNAGATYSFVVNTGECWERHSFSGVNGSNGRPNLMATGPLSSGALVTFELSNAVSNSPTMFVIGFEELLVPYKGGFLYPTVDLLLFGLVTNGQGELTLPLQYPVGAPSVPLYFQTWTIDAGAIRGLAGSRGLKGSTY